MILITGGAGYIGSHLNKLLTQKGYKTIVIDNLSTGHKEFVKWGEFVLGDLGDTNLLELVFDSYQIEVVFHFAGSILVGESIKDPKKYYLNNVINTLNLLNLMVKKGVKNFIFSSTCATYGVPTKIPISENHPQIPINPYGKSKLFIEKVLEDYSRSYGINYISLRYFNAAGADPEGEIGEWHEPETHLIPIVLDVVLGKRDELKVFGNDYPTPDGTCVRDFIHVWDLAEAHLLAMEYLMSEKKSEVFNLGNGRGFSVMEVIKTAEKVTSKKIKFSFAPRREGDAPVLVASSKKAQEILGWRPKYRDIESIIATAWEWHKKLYFSYKKG